jgi:carbonic anhydrase
MRVARASDKPVPFHATEHLRHGRLRNLREAREITSRVSPTRLEGNQNRQMTNPERNADGSIVVEVRQSVRDLQGRPLHDQTHGLKDKTVGHVFSLQNGKVTRSDIRDDH